MTNFEPSTSIQFVAHQIDFKLKYEDQVRDWFLDTVTKEKKSLSQLDVIFCSDEFLLEINKTHLNHDYFTDIITFPFSTDPISGELYISVDRVKDNAKEYKVSIQQEMHRVMIHGLLHLIGYKDSTKEEKNMMRAKEDHYLCTLF